LKKTVYCFLNKFCFGFGFVFYVWLLPVDRDLEVNVWTAPKCPTDIHKQMELRNCDGVNDWQLICLNNCSVNDARSFRPYLSSPNHQRIAVWGSQNFVWTGMGPRGLSLMVRILNTFVSRHPRRKSILKTAKGYKTLSLVCLFRFDGTFSTKEYYDAFKNVSCN